MDTNNITLSVVMPAYNEEQHIKDNLLETSRILSRFLHHYEIMTAARTPQANLLPRQPKWILIL